MITITEIIGRASDPALADRLHHLEHHGRVETLLLDREDTIRRRLRMITNQGTDVAIALERGQSLVDGAVLFLDEVRAIVVRMTEQEWLRIRPRDLDAALEAGYCIGNLHWRVRFEPAMVLVALEGPVGDYEARLAHLIAAEKIVICHD
jgi:urease accessory protein